MKSQPLTVRDYVRAASRVISPLAKGMANALTVNEYVSGRDLGNASFTPKRTLHPPRRPWQQWPVDNTWGDDSEHERFERELWTEQTFLDADTGVTFRESTWDGRWNNDEAWRR